MEDIDFINIDNPRFPLLLKEIPSCPSGLYVKGKLPEAEIALAIVGTRRATTYGLKIAADFAEKLGQAGVLIVSGLAYGIDAAAHEGALRAGAPTVAVLPCGLDTVYPRSHKKLAERILAGGGALVSEYQPGTAPFKQNFLERNRIVSGLANGVIIIEAPEHSGALVTARFAADQGREVFAVPGKPFEPNYKGSHALIRDGARLVTSPEDVLEDLGIKKEMPHISAVLKDETEERIIALLKEHGALSIDKLAQYSNLEPREISRALALLVLNGLVEENGITYFLND
jgi:DNA processing protein